MKHFAASSPAVEVRVRRVAHPVVKKPQPARARVKSAMRRLSVPSNAFAFKGDLSLSALLSAVLTLASNKNAAIARRRFSRRVYANRVIWKIAFAQSGCVAIPASIFYERAPSLMTIPAIAGAVFGVILALSNEKRFRR
jgi:hypothetical protein